MLFLEWESYTGNATFLYRWVNAVFLALTHRYWIAPLTLNQLNPSSRPCQTAGCQKSWLLVTLLPSHDPQILATTTSSYWDCNQRDSGWKMDWDGSMRMSVQSNFVRYLLELQPSLSWTQVPGHVSWMSEILTVGNIVAKSWSSNPGYYQLPLTL